MAGYYQDEEDYRGAPGAGTAFDTMNVEEPHRPAIPKSMMNRGPGPQRVPQFEKMNLGAPVREQVHPPATKVQNVYGSGGGGGGGTGDTPIHPSSTGAASDGRIQPRGLLVTSLCLRVAAALSLIIAVAVLAADSHTVAGVTVSATSLSAVKYALAAAIIGAVYSIYEIVSVSIRLARGHLLLPGKFSLFISYIGDQIVIVLLLTGASAAAATFKDLQDGEVCDGLGSFCGQGAGGIALMFLGFCFLAASLVISSYCFYKNRI
ncbi:hypothetical protein L7F22_021500 [Adiantum nelumboides]|nr:hypothetical protein [Adiantum nelumboides]